LKLSEAAAGAVGLVDSPQYQLVVLKDKKWTYLNDPKYDIHPLISASPNRSRYIGNHKKWSPRN